AKMYRVAIFHQTDPVTAISERGSQPRRILFEELRRLGYEEGRNLTIERYTGGGQPENYKRLAAEIVASRPDLSLTQGTATTGWVGDAAAGKVPIVTSTSDPIAAGFTASLAHPSRNVTGITDVGLENSTKGFELLLQTRPTIKHVAMLTPRYFWE